ncbi:MAG: 5-formyltetrahydrofolate cyclo-ligase [Labilithrix sp.]|nr:5-formyltetrahydrofolate cyclo-ligase [Labilithrix sp.]MCW5815435.1 5-formyltetrahydrofolate cyclo-ligase [Labilithrix sp.]
MNRPPRGVDPGPSDPHSHALAPEEVLRFKVKAELRKRMRGVRKTTPLESIAERSAKIVAALTEHEAVRAARSVALFWPIVARHEVDLRALDAALRTRDVRVAYPTIDAENDVMSFRFVSDVAKLEEQGYGFAEPPADAAHATDLDVIVVPAIAIDPTGHRIGYGAGYYDRTLPRYAPPAVTLAVAFDWQLIAEVPATDGDVRVDWIVTDARVAKAEPSGI